MTTPRRRILRADRGTASVDVRRQARQQKLHDRLRAERASLQRWMTRLKRSFHSVEKIQARITRLERELTKLGQN